MSASHCAIFAHLCSFWLYLVLEVMWVWSYNQMGRKQSSGGYPCLRAIIWQSERALDKVFSDAVCTETCFIPKDHQASCKEIGETERTNCQPGSLLRMTVFHGPPRLLPLYFSVRPSVFHLPHPPLVTIIAKRGLFSKTQSPFPCVGKSRPHKLRWFL